MTSWHSDDYGMWEGMDPSHPDYEENIEFYRDRARTAVAKHCMGCGQLVRIQPEYALCYKCADTIDRGGDVGCYSAETGEEE